MFPFHIMKYASALALVLILPVQASAERLPTSVVPSHYTLWFAPDFRTDTFAGTEIIDVTIRESTSTIVLHSAEIEFQEALVTQNGQAVPARVALDASRETATLTMPTAVAPGPAAIRISFTGHLNDKLRGFYLSTAYKRKYAVTQLAATDARRAFPCFDEPALKATFDISLSIDKGDTAISNTAVTATVPGSQPDKQTVTFARTPKMSTYLVAMMVGRFACREGRSDGIPIRICSTPEQEGLTGFALEAAEQQVRFYNDYFGIKYPFGKLDIIAIPDFAAGAMENTGAITFRESLLLADPATASPTTKLAIAGVIAHEIAHMWFGDLVTMQWWDDVWLNEGFATWMANKPVNAWKPEWATDLADARDTQSALVIDSLKATRPIHFSMETPDEINEAFDTIAYQKGAAVLRMVEQYVGPEVFRKGITAYLNKFAYQNATSSDFADEIGKVAGRPVDGVFKSFVNLPGAPLISVRSTCDGGSTVTELIQERFFGNPESGDPSSSPLWQVPVCFRTAGSSTTTCELLSQRSQTFRVKGTCAPWAFANADARGYFRTAYAPDAVKTLASNASALRPTEIISLLEDEWALVGSHGHEIGDYLTLVTGVRNEATPEVVQTFSAHLESVGNELASGETRQAFQTWLQRTFGDRVRSMGWTPSAHEPPADRRLRSALLRLVGYVGRDPEILTQARERAKRYLVDPASLDPAIVAITLELAAVSGDGALYDAYLTRTQSASSPQSFYFFQNALTYFEDPQLTTRTLDYALSDAVRSQDAPTVLALELQDPSGRETAWEFIKSHWTEIARRLGTFQGIPYVVGGLNGLCGTDRAGDVQQFFAAHPVPAAERALRQTLETLTQCARIKQSQGEKLARWVRENK